MRTDIQEKLPKLIEITKEEPGKYGIYSLSEMVNLCPTTVWKYARSLKLDIKRKRVFTQEEQDFVSRNHKEYRQFEIANMMGLKQYDVESIARKLGVRFKGAPAKKKVKSKFFEHDDYYKVGNLR